LHFCTLKTPPLKNNSLENLEQRLGFDQIKLLIAQECHGEVGKQMAMNLKISRQYEPVIKLQEQADECRKLIQEGIPLPENNFFDLQSYADQLEIEGFVLMADQWSNLSRGLKTIENAVKALRKNQNQFPRLFELCSKVEIPTEIFYRIETVFDTDGTIRDTASPELNRLRKKKIDEQSKLRRKLDNALKSAISQGYIAEDAGITIRNGRMVIPILAEYKRKIKGFVHDESATGQTVYIEPEEALDSNNEIREIQFAENREIHRILTDLTLAIRPFRKEISQANQFLGVLDLVRAKARFGIKIKANLPGHQSGPDFKLFEARHPLLFLSHVAQKKPVVPLTIWLTAEKRVLVISGPNAGGKSICLKTVGLIQYMWQSGVPVSVGEGSRMGFFEKIMVDIGDQQSIENDLSTYSSHISNMKWMLQEANSKTLILLDEFGTGTDPALGGPIAEAILESLCHKKIFGLVNTHYTNLKNFANRHPSIENAAMKFDGEKMEPLFQLEIGQPGSSYALEIAEKIGLPKAVLNQAKNKIGIKKINVDKLISELEEEKQKWEQKNQELANRDRKTKLLLTENEKKHKELDNQRKKILNDAKQKAAQLLDGTNRKIEETIRLIKENQAEKTVTRDARLQLEQLKDKLEPEEIQPVEKEVSQEKVPETKIEVLAGDIKAGDFVRIKGTESIGTFLGFKGKDAEVQIGDLKTNIKLNRLEKVSGIQQTKSLTRASRHSMDLNQKMMEFESQLDIRGLRADEAMSLVDNWLDEAILLGQKELRIVHGKGDGILRTQIRNLLRKYRQVEQIRDEHADRGGSGVTLFQLNV
jgi:DNA mismatch repair protein MutS2